MMEHNGSLKPRPLVEWLCPDTLIDQVCKLTSQDQRQNPRLGQLVREAVRKYHSSDSLRAILEYEQAQLAQQVAARVEPGRLREIALALRLPQGPPEPPAAPTTVRDPDAETIIWNTLETALAAEDQEERHEWAGINTVRLEAPELFMAVQDELRNYQGPDRLHWEIDAELERISQHIADRLDPKRRGTTPAEPWKTRELWPPGMLWSRSWEQAELPERGF